MKKLNMHGKYMFFAGNKEMNNYIIILYLYKILYIYGLLN